MTNRSFALPLVVAAIASWPRLAWPCSGPGAMAAIERAELIGWTLFAATVALAAVVAVLLRRWASSRGRSAWLVLPVVAHPGWWMSARSGDCGATLTLLSIVVTVTTMVVWIGIFARLAWLRRKS